MGFLDKWYNREPKKEIEKNSPEKQGAALFFSVFWREFWELCKLNLILILFCIPVVTIPAALTAMHKIMMFMFMDRPVYTFSDFFAAFKAEWKRASIAGVIYFPILAVTAFGMFFYSAVLVSYVLYIISMLVCAVVLIVGFYLFPMLAVLDMNLKGIFKNAVLLAFLRMPQNVLTLTIIVLLAMLAWMFLPPSIIAVLLIFFTLIGFITTFCAYTGLRKFVITDNQSG